jgi:filamentous hemagglutinin family protein
MRRHIYASPGMQNVFLYVLLNVLAPLAFWAPSLSTLAYAQTPITSSGLNTVVSDPIAVGSSTQYDLTGGTRPGGGVNLFHSFGDFNVPSNNIANFLNSGSVDLAGNPLAAGLPTSNILGSVTGVDPTIIFGMIQTNGPNGFGNANLFLINPHGFLFGPNATLNVGGMVAFTTADYLRLEGVGGNGTFYADTAHASVLTNAPVAAFGFLGLNPAAIAVQGSTLTVAPSQSISFVGGNTGFEYTDPDTGLTGSTSVPDGVTMTGGTLSASGGQINLASVASPGAVSAVDFMPAPGMTMGSINLSQGAILDVSANAAGTVRIRGGQFVIDNATLSADTTNADGAQTAIDINVTGDMSLANELAPALTARTDGIGDAGTIKIQSGNLDAITSSSEDLVTLIDTHTSGTGTAGNVAITTTGNLHATNFNFFIDSGSAGTGDGGAVDIVGANILIEGPIIATGDFLFGQLLEQDVTGSAGDLSMTATESLEVTGSTISTEAGPDMGGNITLNAHDILIQEASQVALGGSFGSATIQVTADSLRVSDTASLNNLTVVAPGGDITINARIVEMVTGGVIRTATIGDGPAGDINITATERFTLNDQGNGSSRPTGLLSNSTGAFENFGSSGSITITTDQMEIFGGAQINTSTRSSGDSGTISIMAQSTTISGERPFETPGGNAQIGSTRASGIYTRTVGSDFCVDACGNAGNITITTDSLNLSNGGTTNSGTTNNGAGGDLTINATNTITISGTMKDGTPSGIYSRTVGQSPDAGTGGNITLTAGQSVTMSNGAAISASSTGPGKAGDISIIAGQQFDMRDSSVTAEAKQASGGNIDIRAVDRIRLVNSEISSSVQGDALTASGNITIDPNMVVLLNSQVIAKADQGAGGNITIFTPLFLADSISQVDASSQRGVNGTVTIQSPNAPASGHIQPLDKSPLIATSLLNQRCASLAGGEFSSFTVAGRDSLPTEPDSWLASPLAALNAGMGLKVKAEGGKAEGERLETPLLSLRQIAPAGFLTQAFAVDWSASCQS